MKSKNEFKDNPNMIKRRKFLFLIFAVGSLPIINFFYKRAEFNPLIQVKSLDQFCDLQDLMKIGRKYLQKNPEDNSYENLKKKLLTDNNNNLFVYKGYRLSNFLEQKIIRDFKHNDTNTINGWFISKTEAQQCALLNFV